LIALASSQELLLYWYNFAHCRLSDCNITAEVKSFHVYYAIILDTRTARGRRRKARNVCCNLRRLFCSE
jgi:hypothetical protein